MPFRLPTLWQKPAYLGHDALTLRVLISRKLNQQWNSQDVIGSQIYDPTSQVVA